MQTSISTMELLSLTSQGGEGKGAGGGLLNRSPCSNCCQFLEIPLVLGNKSKKS